ncbi:universal stress protein [Promicromonospora sp. MS192]|uniref:universal stress protein n=1 Tax=Promicromonospora sp. MS192 TaxID=3412684 RepID=UPI003C2C1F9C
MDTTWYRGMVVGVDGSAESMAAVDWAALTADRHSARLTVLGAYGTEPSSPRTALVHANTRADACDAVERAVARLDGARPGGHDVEQRIIPGTPAYVLTQRSTANDLVVVGRRGLGGWGRAALGSVSAATAATAPGPVAVVPAGAWTGDPRRVVVGLDGDDPDPQLGMAFAEAQQRACPLEIVHGLDPDLEPGTGPDAPGGPERQDVHDRVAQWTGKYPAVSAVLTFRDEGAADALLHGLGPEDLVVVGGRPHSLLAGRVWNSVADAVLRRAAGPVIVVHA